jgi:hypothetical protein
VSHPDQTIMAGGDVPGNCFQAALAGVLGVSLDAVPHFPLLGIHHWMHACVAWLEAEHDLITNTRPDESLGNVRLLHIINGQSPRGYSHAVIGDTTTGEMVHDPHPSRAGLTFINSRFYFHHKPKIVAATAAPLQRYSMGFFQGAPAMFRQPDGDYVKWADVQGSAGIGGVASGSTVQPKGGA